MQILLEFVSKDSIDSKVMINLRNGMAPNRQQAIIWTNDYCVPDPYICVIRPQWVN